MAATTYGTAVAAAPECAVTAIYKPGAATATVTRDDVAITTVAVLQDRCL